MTLARIIKTSVKGLSGHTSRSALTILGIVIGIAALMLIVSVVKGAQNLILSEFQGLGSKTIAVIPGRHPRGPSDFAQIFSDSLKEKDFTELKKKSNIPTAGEIMPVVFGGETASYGNETYRLTLLGASDLINRIFDISPAQGASIAEDDIKSRADVAVIGAKVKEELFGSSDALGQKIKIKGRNFRVIGVLPKIGQVAFFDFDDMALVPYSTAQQYIFGIKYFHRFIVLAESEETVPQTVRDIEATLRRSHGITDPEKDDFFVETQADIADRLATVTDVLTLLLASIAAISLVVGGIGIMNVMLVSVTERTREIGLRKAVGATEANILIQFLVEAVILTVTGGLIGIFLGALLSFATSFALSLFVGLEWTFTFPLSATLLAFGVSAAVGLIFGLYPAYRASRKSPIEALRYE